MEKRLILFLILSFVVMFFYPYLTKKLGNQSAGSEAKRTPGTTKTAGPPDSLPGLPEPPLLTPIAANEVTVETDLLKVAISTQGGVIRTWELKKYRFGGKRAEEHVQLAYQGAEAVYPLSFVPEKTTEINPASELYAPSAQHLVTDQQHPTAELLLNYEDPAKGQRIKKKLTFHQGSYWINLEIEATGLDQERMLFLGTNFGIPEWGDAKQGASTGFIGPMHLIDGKVVHDPPNKITQPVEHQGPIQWTALQDKYFVAALIPQEPTSRIWVMKQKEDQGTQKVTIGLPSNPVGDKTKMQMLLYAGPKEYDTLKALGVHLEETIDFGWFIYGSWVLVRVVAQPLFAVLRFLHNYTHNYGVAIILLTLLVRIIFIPLTHKSYRSMKAMQAIQPKVAALQKKYKDNKEQLNREMLELYRQHKVNPFGGCLPSLLQVPVFVALFNVLYTTIELRQAPFMFWIRDLSDKDPYYILPILMGITMIIQQKLQPSQMDPRQARLMLLMPAFLTVLFLNFPAGLVLYWMTNNLLSIGQQVVTVRYFERAIHEPVRS